MKSGTTSLHSYLLNHPQVLPLKEGAKVNGKEVLGGKETYFFMDPHFSRLMETQGEQATMAKYYEIFPDIYPENNIKSQAISGEATPMYVV